MKSLLLLSSFIAAGIFAGAALAADPPDTATFVGKVAGGNLFEIESSQIAIRKTRNGEVRAFAEKMVMDHTAAGAKFKAAVGEAKIEMPPEKLDSRHQAIVRQLEATDASTIDKPYIDAQKEAHVETVALFEAYAGRGEDPRLKKFAQELLPTLEAHLEHVNRLQAK